MTSTDPRQKTSVSPPNFVVANELIALTDILLHVGGEGARIARSKGEGVWGASARRFTDPPPFVNHNRSSGSRGRRLGMPLEQVCDLCSLSDPSACRPHSPPHDVNCQDPTLMARQEVVNEITD